MRPIHHAVVALAEIYGWTKDGRVLLRDNERVPIVNVVNAVRILGWERASFVLRLRGQTSYGNVWSRPFVELPAA